MNLDDLKNEIIEHLANESNLRVGEGSESYYYLYGENKLETSWALYEDPNKIQGSDWIEKDTNATLLGQVILRETKLYFNPKFRKDSKNPCGELMFLADLISPDSFNIAIKTLRYALNVLNVCKPPKGVGLFGSMTPPNMPPMPFRK